MASKNHTCRILTQPLTLDSLNSQTEAICKSNNHKILINRYALDAKNRGLSNINPGEFQFGLKAKGSPTKSFTEINKMNTLMNFDPETNGCAMMRKLLLIDGMEPVLHIDPFQLATPSNHFIGNSIFYNNYR